MVTRESTITDCVEFLTAKERLYRLEKNFQLVVMYPMTCTRDVHKTGILERLDTTIFLGV